ncbi:MAG: hypothetical protein ACP5G0_08580 [Desulfomonilia bacterium]
MPTGIDEAKDLLEKAGKETAISKKREFFTDGMKILDQYTSTHDISVIANEIRRDHIRLFLQQLSELPVEKIDDVLDIMEILGSMGDMLIEIMENDHESYGVASEKLKAITTTYCTFIRDCILPVEQVPILHPPFTDN